MSLPRIAPYVLPDPSEFPPSRVDWQLDPARAALLVHDMQDYFLLPYGGSPAIEEMIDRLAALVHACRRAGIPVVYTAQPGRQSLEERGLLTDMWGAGIGAVVDERPDLEDIVDRLAPQDDDIRLVKWRYSAFQRSPLAELLAERDRDQLLITGIYAGIGCLATAVEAFMRDIQPFVAGDAVADFSRVDHDWALTFVARRAGVVTSAAHAEQALCAATAERTA